ALGDVFVSAPKQPHGPQCTADANQQHRHSVRLNNPAAFPVKQPALQAFPSALVPPAASIGHESLLGRRQTRYQLPADRSTALACQFVATDIGAAGAAFPYPNLLQKPSAVWVERQRLQGFPATPCFDQGVVTRPKDVVPPERVETGQKGFA